MFEFPLIGARRALATLSLPDSLRILDLDDPHQLVRLGLRPTDVVRWNLAVTQTWGHRTGPSAILIISDDGTRCSGGPTSGRLGPCWQAGCRSNCVRSHR